MVAGRRLAAFTLLAAAAVVGAAPAAVADGHERTGSGSSTLDTALDTQRRAERDTRRTAGRTSRDDEARLTPRERTVLRVAAGVEPGSFDGAALEQTGWWSRVNEEPPETNVVAAPSLPAPDVPQGALPVTVAGGERVRVSAVGISLDGEAGGTVDQLVLVLRESDAPQAALNADGAVVRACQVTTDFWVSSINGKWSRVPAHDCDAGSVEGVRDPETGTWAFDLTSLASGWLADDFTGSPAVLLEAVTTDASGAPAESQVMYDAVEGIGLLAETSPGTDLPLDTDTDTDTGTSSAGGGVGATGGGSGGSGGFGSSGGSSGSGSLPASGGASSLPEPSAAPAGEVPAAAEGDPAFVPVAAAPRPWYGGLGSGAVLLTALVLGLAYLTMLAMGPDAQPVPATTTRRGVSRALDKMRAVGTGLRGKVGR